MPRADNSDRQFLIVKPEDVGMATNGKPETFPFKKLNEALSILQKRIFALEGRTQPPVFRNHLTVLAPPADPAIPDSSTTQTSLFHNLTTGTFKGAESGATSFSDVINRVGMWESSTDTLVGASVSWDSQIVASTPFMWGTGAKSSLTISEPGTYLIQTKLTIAATLGGAVTATLTTSSNAFSQRAGYTFGVATDVVIMVHHLYVWNKTNATSDAILVNFTADDPNANIANAFIPGVLTIVKLK